MKDDFGNRMKAYEREFTDARLDPSLPVYVRLDGRSFSKFTRHMKRPFDERMSKTMVAVTEFLVSQTKPYTAYTQSDEISILWEPVVPPSQFMFDGKIQKLASVLSGMCSSRFVKEYFNNFGELPDATPAFDCRILNLPNWTEALNMVLWRKQDGFKNAVQSAAHEKFGHARLMHNTTKNKISLLRENGIDFFTEYPDFFRLGTEIRAETEDRFLTEDELSKIKKEFWPIGPVTRTVLVKSYPSIVEDRFRNGWESGDSSESNL